MILWISYCALYNVILHNDNASLIMTGHKRRMKIFYNKEQISVFV